METIYDKTRPPLFTEAGEIEYQGETVITLSVEHDGTTYATTDGRCLRRLGKNSQPYYPDEMSNKYSAVQNPDFSGQIIVESTENDINKLEIYKLKEKLKARDPESALSEMEDMSFLSDLGLIKYDAGNLKLTIAGLLSVGKEQAIHRLLPQAALLNALAHRDYQNQAAVYVKHYPDKIVIENPGGFPEGITEHNIITHPSVPRNKLIAETLQRLKYVQRTGQGVDIIFRDMVSSGKPYPEYRAYNDAVSLSIYSAIDDVEFVKFVAREQNLRQRNFSLSELMILRYLTDNRRISLAIATDLIQGTRDMAQKSLNSLIRDGLIEVSGKEYMLTAKMYEAVKSDIEYTQDKVLQYVKAKGRIMEYVQETGSITNAQVRELCGFTRQQARSALEKMQIEGVIVLLGKGRYAKYVASERLL